VEFYKVITDPKTGQYAAVDSDKEAVSLKDKAGKTIWEKNIKMELTKKHSPFLGDLGDDKIWSMTFYSNKLYVYIWHSSIVIDKNTGDITAMATD
jgi:hypothetical protein